MASAIDHGDLGVFRGRHEAVELVDEDVGSVGVLRVVLQHRGHRVVLATVVVEAIIVSAAAAAVPRGRGLVPVGVEPQVVAVGEVDVRNVVHFVHRNCKLQHTH